MSLVIFSGFTGGRGEWVTTFSLQAGGQRTDSVHLAEKLCSFFLLSHIAFRVTFRYMEFMRSMCLYGKLGWRVGASMQSASI